MICATLTDRDVKSMVHSGTLVNAELVEMRLDYISDFSGVQELSSIPKRRIATCMPSWEGGQFKGSEPDRMRVLEWVLPFSEFVTLELRMEPQHRDPFMARAKKAGIKVIVAHHDFSATPGKDEIINILNAEIRAGADVAKLAFTANSFEDVLRLMEVLLEEKSRTPIIAVSMGPLGKLSRVMAPLLGSYLTFAAVDWGLEAVPGQLTVEELRKILDILK